MLGAQKLLFKTAAAGGGTLAMSTPVFTSTGSTNADISVSITVPSGTTALLLFWYVETTGAAKTLNGVSDGTQNATQMTGTNHSGGAGPANAQSTFYMLNPTVGTSTWTWDTSSTTGLSDQVAGYAFVSGGHTSDLEAGTATVSSTTSTTARDLAVTTDVANALCVSWIGGRDHTVSFTWDGSPVTSVYTSAQTSTWVAVATRQATSTGSYSLGGDWSASPTRSLMTTFALRPA
jgi:hypothetical protein